jgi:hypothetical protein
MVLSPTFLTLKPVIIRRVESCSCTTLTFHWFVNTVNIKIGRSFYIPVFHFLLAIGCPLTPLLYKKSGFTIALCRFEVVYTKLLLQLLRAMMQLLDLHTFDFSMILLKWNQKNTILNDCMWHKSNRVGFWFDLLRWFLILITLSLIPWIYPRSSLLSKAVDLSGFLSVESFRPSGFLYWSILFKQFLQED